MRNENPIKTPEQLKAAVQESLSRSTDSALEAIDYLVKTKQTGGFIAEGFPDWESFCDFVIPKLRFGSPQFIREMVARWERGEVEVVIPKVWERIAAHGIEHANQGDN